MKYYLAQNPIGNFGTEAKYTHYIMFKHEHHDIGVKTLKDLGLDDRTPLLFYTIPITSEELSYIKLVLEREYKINSKEPTLTIFKI